MANDDSTGSQCILGNSTQRNAVIGAGACLLLVGVVYAVIANSGPTTQPKGPPSDGRSMNKGGNDAQGLSLEEDADHETESAKRKGSQDDSESDAKGIVGRALPRGRKAGSPKEWGVCGRRTKHAFPPVISGRVVNGVKAGEEEYPWLGSFMERKGKSKSFCGASLLNHHWLITAAHCCERVNKKGRYRKGLVPPQGCLLWTIFSSISMFVLSCTQG